MHTQARHTGSRCVNSNKRILRVFSSPSKKLRPVRVHAAGEAEGKHACEVFDLRICGSCARCRKYERGPKSCVRSGVNAWSALNALYGCNAHTRPTTPQAGFLYFSSETESPKSRSPARPALISLTTFSSIETGRKRGVRSASKCYRIEIKSV